MNKWFKFVIIIFILAGALLVPFRLWLETNPAQEKITQYLEEIINDQLGLDVKISGLSISFPLVATVNNITLQEKGEDIIAITNLSVQIKPSLFSLFTITIPTVALDELKINALPNYKLKDTAGDQRSFFNPNIVIKNIDFKKIILSKSLTKGEEIIVSLNSSLGFDSSAQQLEFDLTNKLIAPSLQEDNEFKIAGSYDIGHDILDIKSLEIKSDFITANGGLKIDKAANKISGKIKYHSHILEQILSKQFDGTKSLLDGTINLSGLFSKPEIQILGNLAIDLPKNDYLKFDPISWDSKFLLSDNEVAGSLSISQEDMQITSDLGYKNNKVYLHNLKAIAPDFEKTADLILDPYSLILKGTISVRDKTLVTSSKTLPFLQRGDVDLTMTYSSPDNKTQHMNTRGGIKQLRTKFGNCDLIDIDLNTNDLWNAKLAPSKLNLTTLNVNDIILNQLDLKAYSNKNSLHINASVNNNQPYPMQVNISTILSSANDIFSARISNVSGSINSVPIKNSKEITFNTGKKNSFKIDDLIIGTGALNSNMEWTENDVKSNIHLRNIPLNLLPTDVPSNLRKALITGTIDLSGPKITPILNSDFDVSNIDLKGSTNKFSLKASTTLSSKKSLIQAKLFELTQPIASFSATLPSEFSLLPFNYSFNNKKPFTSDLLIIKSFDLLSMIPMPSGNKMNGEVIGNLQLSGTLDTPVSSGNLKIINGSYNYVPYGFLLKNISTEIVTNGQNILLNNIIAQDRSNNRLTASGSVALDKEKNFNFSLNTDKFIPMNSPYLQGEIKGNLDIKGDAMSATSKGKFLIGPLEIKIPEHFQEDIPALHVTKIIKPDDIKSLEYNPYKLNLDINLQTDKKVYVRGWGVDTELQGDLHVTGYAHEPLINGSLKSVRGKYSEFGKSLTVKEGVLNFDGPIPPSPYLKIIGTHNVGSNEIRLILSGSIKNTDVSIESTPNMSQEEALSMLLFGEDSTNISTFQALQLADGVRRLSGHGGGFDPMNMGRKILGVDKIDFKNDTDNSENTSISAGKYLSDKVYFEVETGRHENSTKTKIEVQLTPKISIENSVEQNGNNSLSINWRFDY